MFFKDYFFLRRTTVYILVHIIDILGVVVNILIVNVEVVVVYYIIIVYICLLDNLVHFVFMVYYYTIHILIITI